VETGLKGDSLSAVDVVNADHLAPFTVYIIIVVVVIIIMHL